MPISSRELVRALLASRPVPHHPFIPFLASAAAGYMQVPVQRMYSDPTTLANSLQACQRLFRHDGVVVLYDTTLEAEACGCSIEWPEGRPPAIASPIGGSATDLAALDSSGIESRGRVPVVLEAARRLKDTIGRDVALLGAVTGPTTFARHLTGRSWDTIPGESTEALVRLWEKIALALARAYGEMLLDAVVVIDHGLGSSGPDSAPVIRDTVKTLSNLARFYDVPVIIHAGAVDERALSHLSELDVEGFSVAYQPDQAPRPESSLRVLGLGVAAAALTGSSEDAARSVREMASRDNGPCFFVTSEAEVPPETPAANLHSIVQALQAI
jgi:uroporphyrinogen-III decarboxylase